MKFKDYFLCAVVFAATVCVCSAQFLIDPYRFTAGGGGSPGDPVTVAELGVWYDFDDATDAIGSNDLTPVATPTYAGGVGSAYATGDHGWDAAALNTLMSLSDVDQTIAMRCRHRGAPTNGSYAFSLRAARWYVRVLSGVWRGRARIVIGDSASGPSADTWATVVIQYKASTGTMGISVNGAAMEETAGSSSDVSGASYIGGSSTSAMLDWDFDWFTYKLGLFTPDQITWLHNSGAGRTSADLL